MMVVASMSKFLPLKQRLLLLIVGMSLLAILIGALVIFPTVKRINMIGNDIAETEKFLETEYLRTRELKKSITNIEDVAREARVFERAVIRLGEELRVITELEALAETHRIAQSLDIAFIDLDTKAGLSYFTFSFVNRGEFSDMVKHLRALEQLPYYVFIDTLSWERERSTSRGTADGALTLRFTAKIYVHPTKE
jgi:Tfp pilus assembly protein PilO